MSNNVFNESTNEWWVNGTMRFTNIHRRSECAGENCIVHNPSDTVANREDWPYSFRADGRIERFCKHGVGHADVDQVNFLKKTRGGDHWGVHGCCGCCSGQSTGLGESEVEWDDEDRQEGSR